LATKTLGLVGFGAIGQRVARRARAFGLTVLATSPHLTDALAEDHGVQRADLPALLSRSDFVSLHLPAGPATRHLIDGAALARMQPTAWLINTARGSLVDEPALARALRNGQLAGAALDVRATEPPTAPDPLADCPNLILTPHAAYYSTASLVELRQRAARNVAAVLTGDPPPNPINPYLVPRAERRRAGDGGLWV
jgi:D-3-phosphoglycerate dehydrogenase